MLFPTLKDQGITKLYHLGDLVDRRKFINFNTLNVLRESLLDPLDAMGVEQHYILGNHDMTFRNVVTPNALDELLGTRNVHVYTRPTTNADNICVVPWICAETEAAAIQEMESTQAPICFGHFHLQGFEMHRGTYAESGLDAKVLDKFSLVCSGHFHTKSTFNNINYLGSTGEQTWADHMDRKGLHILDTETMALEFIQNPHRMFHKIAYDDRNTTLEDILATDLSHIKGGFVKVIIKEKLNPYWFDVFASKVDDAGPHNVQYVEDHLNLYVAPDAVQVSDAQDTRTILNSYVNEYKQDLTSDKLKSGLTEVFEELYREALAV